MAGSFPPVAPLPHAWAPTHDVQFYAVEEVLYSSIGRFLVEGARAGQPILVVATGQHRRAFEQAMRDAGVEPADLVEGRDIVWLDARETLSAFMEGGHPSPELFEATVGSVLQRLMRDRRYVIVRAYGEMVDLLWQDGKMEAALQVEHLWNGLATRYAFALRCAYAVDGILKSECKGIDRICGAHSRVLPSNEAAA